MGLAISRLISRDGYDYEADDPLELRHLALSELEETLNVQSGACPPALGGRASWSRKVQVGRIFGAAPHPHQRRSQHTRSFLLSALFMLVGVMVATALYVGLGYLRPKPVNVVTPSIYLFETIGDRAFYISDRAWFNNTNLRGTLKVGPAVTSIGAWTFAMTDLTGLDLSEANALRTIGNNAFHYNRQLTGTLKVAPAITSIGAWAFAMTDLTGLDLSEANALRTIGNNAFSYNRQLTGTLKVAPAITLISDSAFENTGFTGLDLSEATALETIGYSAFYNTHLTGTLKVGPAITSIGALAFAYTGLTGLDLTEANALRTTSATTPFTTTDSSPAPSRWGPPSLRSAPWPLPTPVSRGSTSPRPTRSGPSATTPSTAPPLRAKLSANRMGNSNIRSKIKVSKPREHHPCSLQDTARCIIFSKKV